MVNINGAKANMYKKNAAIICFAGLLQVNFASAKSTLTTTGDILQIALPVAAFSTAFLKEKKNSRQAIW